MSEVGEQLYQAFNTSVAFDYFDEVEELKAKYESLKPFNETDLDGLQSYEEDFKVRFVYNSNSLEGSTLSLGDTALVLDGEFPPHRPDSKLRDIFAAKGCFEGCSYAVETISEYPQLTEDYIKDTHQRTALDCQPRTRGVYRMSPAIIKGSMTAPVDAFYIRECMADLVYQFNNCPNHPLVKIAAFHAMFERIHPFIDCNGRTGRNIMNAMLVSFGYPQITIKASAKGEYNGALEDWQVKADPSSFLRIFKESIIEEYKAQIKILEATRECVKKLDKERTKAKDREIER